MLSVLIQHGAGLQAINFFLYQYEDSSGKTFTVSKEFLL
jgi:hypothetical protein